MKCGQLGIQVGVKGADHGNTKYHNGQRTV